MTALPQLRIIQPDDEPVRRSPGLRVRLADNHMQAYSKPQRLALIGGERPRLRDLSGHQFRRFPPGQINIHLIDPAKRGLNRMFQRQCLPLCP